MKLKPYIPTGPRMVQEVIIVLAGVLGAAFVLSRFPALKAFVSNASITVNDQNGNNLF